MTENTETAEQQTQTTPPLVENNMRQLAWVIMIASFIAFCVLFLSSTLGLYFFLFESTATVDATVSVGRGTSVITDADVADRALRTRDILVGRPAFVSTDNQSQALLSLETIDGSDRNSIALLTLTPDTNLTINNTWQPRFEWSNGRYTVEINDVVGGIDILVPNTLDRPIFLQIRTQTGMTVHITGAGRYTLEASDSRVQITNHFGEPTVLFATDLNRNVVVGSEQVGVIVVERDTPVLTPATINILENGLFTFNQPLDSNLPPVPERWGCTNVQVELPRGEVVGDIWNNVPALRLVRGDNASTNGQTRCKHPFSGEGFDVTEFALMELETTFLINFQSLSECGIEGSECPIMLHMEYTDVNGVPREWYKGFYYNLDPQFDYFKARCASCIEDHQIIGEKTWYTYNTGNLFDIFTEDVRPARITNIEFYASGHQYDVFVSDIAMNVGIGDVSPAEVNIPDPLANDAPPTPATDSN